MAAKKFPAYFCSASRKYIRLLIIHPGTWSDRVHLELKNELFDLESTYVAQYEALSYAWGSKDNPVVVKMGPNGQYDMPVTRNLSEALIHLRDPKIPRTMWIDVICINQADDAEKSAQVAMMGLIYKSASRVVAWLGLERQNSARAFYVLDDIGSQVVPDYKQLTIASAPFARDPTTADITRRLRYSITDAWAIKDLIERPWFGRLWIWQEAVLAREVILQAGTHSISWRNFGNALFRINLRFSNPSLSQDPFCQFLGQCDKFAPALNLSAVSIPWVSFTITRIVFRTAQCEDPRDKIYTMLSILNPEELGLRITPDYSKTAAAVFTDVVVKYVQTLQRLDILDSCELQGASRIDALPSWVPDWSTPALANPVPQVTEAPIQLRAKATFKSNGVLGLVGVDCGVVTEVFDLHATQQPTVVMRVVDACLQLLSIDTALLYPIGGKFSDALCRVVLFNDFSETSHETNYTFAEAKEIFLNLQGRPVSCCLERDKSYARRLRTPTIQKM